jgi:large subunit ribosomal protein L25
MSEIFELEAQAREAHGKGAIRRLRRLEQLVPAVIYGAGKDNADISIPENIINKAITNEAFFSHILTIKVGKKTEKVVVKAIQRHPYKPQVMHMDFMRVNAKEKLKMNVPLHFINEDQAPGVKAGGVVSHLMTEVEIACLPANLPEFIEVDMAKLEVGGAIHLSEIKLPKGIELTALQAEDAQDHSVANIHEAKAAASESTTEEAADSEETAGEDNAE